MINLTEQYRELEQDFFAYQKMLNEANKDLNKYCLENTELKELLKQVLRHELSLKEVTELTRKISEVLGDSRR